MIMMVLLLISDDHPGAGEPWHPADKSSSSSCRRKDKGRLETFFTFHEGIEKQHKYLLQNKDWWTESIAGFDVAVGRSNTLCGWIFGKAARHVETLTEEEVWNLERLVEISMLDMAGPQACCLLVRLL